MKRIVFLVLFLLCCSCGVVPKSSRSFERPIYTVYEVVAPDSLTAEQVAAYPMRISACRYVMNEDSVGQFVLIDIASSHPVYQELRLYFLPTSADMADPSQLTLARVSRLIDDLNGANAKTIALVYRDRYFSLASETTAIPLKVPLIVHCYERREYPGK